MTWAGLNSRGRDTAEVEVGEEFRVVVRTQYEARWAGSGIRAGGGVTVQSGAGTPASTAVGGNEVVERALAHYLEKGAKR